jgi:hypothetical protein
VPLCQPQLPYRLGRVDVRSVYVGTVVDNVVLGQVFLRVLTFSPVSDNPSLSNTNKVKWSHTGLGRPLGLQEVEAPRQSAQEGGKVASPLPPRKDSWYSFLLEAESTLILILILILILHSYTPDTTITTDSSTKHFYL